jgi:hypothetical protein
MWTKKLKVRLSLAGKLVAAIKVVMGFSFFFDTERQISLNSQLK